MGGREVGQVVVPGHVTLGYGHDVVDVSAATQVFIVGEGPRVVKNIPRVQNAEIILPGEWEMAERRWDARQRRQENEILVRCYGLRACRDGGIISEDDILIGQLDKVEMAPPDLAGTEAL